MENLTVENKKHQIILKLNKKGFDKNFVISLIKRIKLEYLSYESEIDSDILKVAEEINQEWWDKNEKTFLKGVKK